MAVFIHDTNIISPSGFSTEDNFQKILSGKSAIEKVFIDDKIGSVYAGKINDELFNHHFQSINTDFQGSRIEKLLLAALSPIVEKNPIKADSVLILSTTKGNISALAKNDLNGAFIDQFAKNINSYFGFKTEPIIVSNACTSGVMALSLAKRFIEMEQSTNAYVVAVDELTPFVVSGFQSFQAMSNEPCKPYDADRTGVNLGEAAVAVFVSNENRNQSIQILGDANINDANHISGPSRTGEGLFLSIEKALNEAQIALNQIDCISAHGTATLFNDEMEAVAFNRLNLQNVPTNSLKGYFGHTLGASGLLETVITVESLKNNVLIPSFGYQQQGTTQQINIITKKETKTLKTALKTASGFGGSNSAMILVKNVDHVRN